LFAHGQKRTFRHMEMRAAVYDRYGPPGVLRVCSVPKPVPAADEVLVAVGATTVTAACGMMRRGTTLMSRLLLGLARPRERFRVLGMEIAGTVESTGAKVTRFRPGDRVFGFTGFGAGGYAQYVCMDAAGSLAHIPAGLGLEDAATLVDGPSTALYFLVDRAGLRAGDRVVIIGASGSIGTAAVQIARHLGADVTAVCSGRNAELVRALGAHHVVDYTVENCAARGNTYDIVFDTVGKSSFRAARSCLAPGGRYLVTTGGFAAYARDLWSRCFGNHGFVFGMSVDKRDALHTVSDLVARGALRAVIDRRYALGNIAEAHRYVESGRKRGNVVIGVGDA
jgi:NADPH:quinone reductase-like Zn-dependent oxidoreductase